VLFTTLSGGAYGVAEQSLGEDLLGSVRSLGTLSFFKGHLREGD
jgi:hypothetical protein